MASEQKPSVIKFLISSDEYDRLRFYENKFQELTQEVESLKKKLVQSGGNGVHYIVPAVHDSIETPTLDTKEEVQNPLSNYNIDIVKNDDNDVFDESALLHLIPNNLRSRAFALLQKLQDRGGEFTWNTNGLVFINQVAIPNSNLFQIFPCLFQKQFPRYKIDGLLEVKTKLQQMGLSEYFTLDRKDIGHNITFHHSEDKQGEGHKLQTDVQIPWWFIG